MVNYNIEDLLYEDLIFQNFKSENQEDFFKKIVEILTNKGYVKSDYFSDLIEREQKYPTGLPTNLLKVAIPHAETDQNVINPAISIVKLKEPVLFKEMGSLDSEVSVDMIFLLAVKGNKTQLSLLPKLISIFSDQDKMTELSKLETTKEIYNFFKNNSQ